MFFTLFRSHLGQFLDIADCPSIRVSIPKPMEVLLQLRGCLAVQSIPEAITQVVLVVYQLACLRGSDWFVLYSETLGPN